MISDSIEVKRYCEAWSGSLALLLSQLTAKDFKAESVGAEQGDLSVFVVSISTSRFAGQQRIGLRPADLNVLLTAFLGEETSVSAELDEMQRQATEELFRQWSGLAADALRGDWGELSFDLAVEPHSHVTGAPAAAKLLRVSDGERTLQALLTIDEGLAGALEKRETPDAAPAGSPAPDASHRIQELLREGNLDLLLDVELAVMLRFGSREATLREVLDMATGAVLELDREIQEPVDLVLNDKVIARGEVVVIDGNYGLRVTEVASPQQRICSL